jgi:hypothetical protein
MNVCEPSKQKKLVCLDFGKKRTLRNLTTPTLVSGFSKCLISGSKPIKTKFLDLQENHNQGCQTMFNTQCRMLRIKKAGLRNNVKDCKARYCKLVKTFHNVSECNYHWRIFRLIVLITVDLDC